jgi:hypothetical protein
MSTQFAPTDVASRHVSSPLRGDAKVLFAFVLLCFAVVIVGLSVMATPELTRVGLDSTAGALIGP